MKWVKQPSAVDLDALVLDRGDDVDLLGVQACSCRVAKERRAVGIGLDVQGVRHADVGRGFVRPHRSIDEGAGTECKDRRWVKF